MRNQYHPDKGYTLGGIFRAYLIDLTHQMEIGKVPRNAVSLARTAILTYAVPGLGGPIRSGKRTTQADIDAAMHFLDSLLSDRVREVVAAQERYFEQAQVAAKVRKTNRYQANLFLTWATEQGLLGETVLEEVPPAPQVYRHSRREEHLKGKPYVKDLRLTDRQRRDDFGLRPEEMNDPLQQQMAALAQFEQDYLNHRQATINNYGAFILRVLGWQHRYRQVPLDELSLYGIIPKTPLKVSLTEIQARYPDPEEAMTKFLLRQQLVRQQAEQQAQEADRWLEEYLAFYQDSPHTQVQTIQALIAVAKSFYVRDTANTNSKSGYTDIPIVVRLRQKLSALNQNVESMPQAIPYAKRSVPWETVLEVFKQQQEKVENVYYSQVFKHKDGTTRVSRMRRKPKAIAVDLQKLLALGFFCLIPPERNRTISELEVGRTLVRGTMENGLLVPMEDMSNPERAQWFLNLTAKDYKTGKVYKDYCAPIEDIPLAYGKTFYTYIQLWLEEYRPLFNPDHQRLFIKTKTTMGATPGESITYRNMTGWIKYLFFHYTGVPVVPKLLRKMYVTHLKNRNASEAELEAAARAMHHSRAMQSAEYDQQDLQDKLAPIRAFNQRLLAQAFDGVERPPLPLTADGQLKLADLSDEHLKALLKSLRAEEKRRKQSQVA